MLTKNIQLETILSDIVCIILLVCYDEFSAFSITPNSIDYRQTAS